MKIAERVRNLSPSPTLGITAMARKMQNEGIYVINFAAGEPDFDTPSNIKTAAINSINEGFTKYTPSSGIEDLKKAVVEKLKKENGLEYKTSEIVISCGAKHAIFNAIMCLCNPGDEVIIISPYWVSYEEMVKLAEGIPVIIKTNFSEKFKLNLEKIKEKINKKTKIIILNSPSNPTGVILEKEVIKEIAKIATENNIYVISDEIYEKIVYENKYYSIAKEIKDLTILINGVSKSYSMTGWRIGYSAANEEISRIISNFQDHSTSCPASISQKAALEAISGPQKSIEVMIKEFEKRRNFIVKALNEIKGIECHLPEGAFYVFPKVSYYFGKKYNEKIIENSLNLTEYLLTEARVATVPGVVFGEDTCIRLSFATSLKDIKEGIKRMKEALEKL